MRRIPVSARALQEGIAAIEFAFVFVILFLLLYGLVTFGSAFYTTQVLTRAAEDGARVVTMFHNPTQAQIEAVVLDSLGAPLKDTPDLEVTSTVDADPVVVTVTYPYRANTLLLSLPFASDWIPPTLRGRAFAAKPTS